MTDASPALQLAGMDPLFQRLMSRNGEPPLWLRPATFGTLVRLVLEQQVSLRSAQAAHIRLVERIGEPSPEPFLTLDDDELRAIGFSRQKSRYCRVIASRLIDGTLDLDRVSRSGDDGRRELLSVTGIGPWTVACYLLFVVGEEDIWPTGDRALYVSMARNLNMDDVPTATVADEMARAWAPHRSTAARMLWHDYLGGRQYTPDARAGFVDETGKVSG